MPAPRASTPPLLIAALLLLASPVAAKVVEVAPGGAAEKGGTPTSPKAAACPSCAMVLPFGPFGWFGMAEAEMLARWAAPLGTVLAAERARWRAPRIAGRPRQTPRSLRGREKR